MAAATSEVSSRVSQSPIFMPPEQDMLYATSNEEGQDGTRKIVQSSALKLQGNAFWGCSGNFILDLASYRDEVQRIDAFDRSQKVARFWEGMKVILSDPKLTLEEARIKIGKLVFEIENRQQCDDLIKETANGRSWLSSQERFDRVHKVFLNKRFTFTPCDLGNREQFGEFVRARTAAGSVPALIYISNIARMPTGAHGGGFARYRDFDACLEMIPTSAMVIDAGKRNQEDLFATQSVHFPNKKRQLMPKPLSSVEAQVIKANDYAQVRFCTARGMDPNGISKHGYSYLAGAAMNGWFNSAQALIDSGADVNKLCFVTTEEDESIGLSMAPLHIMAWNGLVEGVRFLLKNGANLDAKDGKGLTALQLTKLRHVPCYTELRLENPKAYQELQDLLSGKIKVKPHAPAPAEGKEGKEKKGAPAVAGSAASKV